MRRAASLTLFVLLAGCASGPALLDQNTAEPYATLLAHAADYPRSAERVNGGPAGDGELGVQVTHIASPAHSGELIVFVNGILSSASTSARFLVGPLGTDHDLLMLDLPGTGASAKPESTRLGPEAYTSKWLGAHVLRALDRWSKQKDRTDRLTLVGHSMGAASILRALSDPEVRSVAPDVVARVDHLVLVSPPDVVLTEPSTRLETLSWVDQTVLDILCGLGIADDLLKEGIRKAVVEPSRDALKQEVMNFGRAVLWCESRRASTAMLLRYHALRPDGEIDEAEGDRLKALHETLSVPVLIFAGSHDDVVIASNGRALAGRIPNATFVCLRAKHSVHQEQAVEVGRLTRAFLSGEAIETRPCPPGER